MAQSSGEEKFFKVKWFQKYLKALPNNHENNHDELRRLQQDPQRAGILQNETGITGEPTDHSDSQSDTDPSREEQTLPPPQSAVGDDEAEKTERTIVRVDREDRKNEDSPKPRPKPQQPCTILVEQEEPRYTVVLHDDEIVLDLIGSNDSADAADRIPVAEFKKYVSQMNSSTFHDNHSIVSDLLDEISKLEPAPPAVFNKWNPISTANDQALEYQCLPSICEELNVILKVPSSLIKLLHNEPAVTKTMLVNSSSSSTTHEVCIDIIGSAVSDDHSSTDSETNHELAALLEQLHMNSPPPLRYLITDINALLALIVVLKCYPKQWWEEFFWDAWLAVTIQMYIVGNPELLQ